jgi:hypothetical protein
MVKKEVICESKSGDKWEVWTTDDIPDVVEIIKLMFDSFPDDAVADWRKDIVSFVPNPVFMKAFKQYHLSKNK